jgi:hypothetical protein
MESRTLPKGPPIRMRLSMLIGNPNRICAQVAQWQFLSPTTENRFRQIILLSELRDYPSRIHLRLVNEHFSLQYVAYDETQVT